MGKGASKKIKVGWIELDTVLKAKGNIWLKSGSMEGVQSYSGYIKSKNNNWYSFAFMVNGFQTKGRSMRIQMEQILNEIYLHL